MTHDEIAKLSYSIWEHEGRPSGRDSEHWALAQAALTGEDVKSAKPAKRKASPPKLSKMVAKTAKTTKSAASVHPAPPNA